MAELGIQIIELVAGNDIRVQREYTGLPAGVTLSKAWMTVKAVKTDPDPGIFQLIITTVLSSAGRITDADSADGILAMFFDISKVQSALLTPKVKYNYDVQVMDLTVKIYTLEIGTIKLEQRVTSASS